jgi:hypothetical protein
MKHLIQNKRKPPVLNAQLKLHKADIPIRPVVNNVNAPTCKVAKFLTQILNECLSLDSHCCSNSINLAHELIKFKIIDNYRFITYDIN